LVQALFLRILGLIFDSPEWELVSHCGAEYNAYTWGDIWRADLCLCNNF